MILARTLRTFRGGARACEKHAGLSKIETSTHANNRRGVSDTDTLALDLYPEI